jgi:hypothetical protein
LIASFDWQTALPQGQVILPPSILVMSSSRQVLVMSQATSLPFGSRVARMSQIVFLHSLRASFSAFSSGVGSRLSSSVRGVVSAGAAACGAGLAGVALSSAAKERAQLARSVISAAASEARFMILLLT